MIILRLIFYFLANLLALLVLSHYVNGFIIISNEFVNLITLAIIFTILNTYIRPIIKFILTPLVIVTFGLFSLIINAGILIILDFLSKNITINGLMPLAYSAVLIALINMSISITSHLFLKID